MRKHLIVWGAGGHALVVADAIRLNDDYEIVAFVDDVNPQRRGATLYGAPIIGGRERLLELRNQGVRHVLFGFGDCQARLRLSEFVRAEGFSLATAIHPKAIVAADASIGAGTVIAAGAVINPGCKIGENVIVNTSAGVDHECIVKDGVHIGPGARLGGRVVVQRASQIGIGAVVRERVRIGANSIIGAGGVVLRDVPQGVVAYGNPAKVVRTVEPLG